MARCAFCNRDSKLTAEHVWPDWLIEFIPTPDYVERNKRLLTNFRFRSDLPEGFEVVREEERDEGRADVPSVVNVVCHECNHGWMSRLETDVQPILKPLVHARTESLAVEEQQRLAFWAAKTTMMVEFTDAATRVTTPGQRAFLYDHRDTQDALPAGFVVFAGRFADNDEPLTREYAHRSAAVRVNWPGIADYEPVKDDAGNLRGNFQGTTFVIGKLILVVCSTTVPFPGYRPRFREDERSLRRIYRPLARIGWPPTPFIDRDASDRIAFGFVNI